MLRSYRDVPIGIHCHMTVDEWWIIIRATLRFGWEMQSGIGGILRERERERKEVEWRRSLYMRECTHPYKVCVITGIAMFTLFIFLFELPSVEDICRAYNYARENCLGRVQLNQLNLDSFAVNVIYTRVQFGKLFFKLRVWYSITFTTNLPITLMIFANWQS